MNFADLEAIGILTVPLALAAIYWFTAVRRRRLTEGLLGARLLAALVLGARPGARFWKAALRVVAAVLVGLAVMRPQWGVVQTDIVRRGIDVVFAVDVSRSMLAEDVQPNRLERVKQDIRYFVDQVVRDDRIALTAFAGSARVLCPLTLDRSAFDIFLDELAVGSIPQGGTDLAAALEESMAAFGDEERNHKAIIVFSDGEEHEGIDDEILQDVRRRGIRLYTVGIGSEEGVVIPILDKDGSKTVLKDADGNIVVTRLNDRVLKSLAQATTDGAYTHLSAGRRNLVSIYEDNIKQIEERELASKKQVRGVDRFQWFVAFALLLLAIEAAVNDGARSAARLRTSP